MAFLRAFLRCSASPNRRVLLSGLQGIGKIDGAALKSTAAGAIVQDANPAAVQTPPKDPLDITFEDAKAAFKSKTMWELVRAYIVYTLCSSNYIVENNMKIMKLTKTILGDKLFTIFMKATFYGHFVAGEDQYTIRPTLERLRSFGVKPILDYSVEEDISQEEAEKREIESSVPEGGDQQEQGSLKQYHVAKPFADRRLKVSSARTYFYINEAQCERNMEIFIRCLEAVADYDRHGRKKSQDRATYGTGITAVKLTALGRPQLLLQLSEVIMRTRKYMAEVVGGEGNVLKHHFKPQDLVKRLEAAHVSDKDAAAFMKQITSDKDGILHLFPWSGIIDENQELSATFRVPDMKTGRMVRLITQLSRREEEMFRNFIRRFDTIVKVPRLVAVPSSSYYTGCAVTNGPYFRYVTLDENKAAQEMDVRIMVDAEQTYFQPAITRITLEFMRKYNKEKAVVFNTYQCYLRDTYNEVTTDLEQSKRQNFYFGAKLVRGAYLEQERARAAALGYPDPTNPNFDATTEMYHRTLTECLRRIKDLKDKNEDKKKIAIMVASHNEDTVRFAIQKMNEIGILPEDKVICFGQLLAMCDYITFPLGQSGYSAYKYIPYGPVNEVLPYLSRRAQENKGILKKIKKEKRLLLSEIFRRTIRGQLFYTPKGNYVPV